MSKRGNFNTNVQIPIGILLKMKWIINELDRADLDARNRPHFDEVKAFIEDKERKIINRMHYEEYVQTKGEEKEAALETYLAYKNAGKTK